MSLPTLRNIEAAEKLYNMLDSWKLANCIISSYFKEHPANVERTVVVIKVVLISTLYVARIFEPLKMAAHIVELHGLDLQLRLGEVEAVERIAHFDRYEKSFASKYAHFHNKVAFPILDSFAVRAMAQLQERRLGIRNYTRFFEAIEAFRQQAGLTAVPWEDLDKYLWLYGQKKALDQENKSISREVTTLYGSFEGHTLFEALEPPSQG